MASIYRRRDARWELHQAITFLSIPNLAARFEEYDFFAISAEEFPINRGGVDCFQRHIFGKIFQSVVVRRECFPS